MDSYFPNTSKYNRADGLTTLVSGDDVATVLWGDDWRIPTKAEWEEILAETTHEMTTQDGVVGRLFTSKADPTKSIFLPAASYQQNGSIDYLGKDGEYWSNSLYTDYGQYGQNHPDYGNDAVYFWFTARNRDPNYNFTPTRRCYGLSVRAVRAN